MEDGLADPRHQTAALGCLDEAGGVEEADLGPLPPHQGFERGEAPGLQLHHRLIEDPELVVVDGMAKRDLGLALGRDPRLERGIGQLVGGAALVAEPPERAASLLEEGGRG